MQSEDETRVGKAVGSALSEQRALRGLTQEDVAATLGIGPEAVSRMERGVVIPSLPRLIEFAELYKCSLESLIGGASNQPVELASAIAHKLEQLGHSDRQLVRALIETCFEHMAKK